MAAISGNQPVMDAGDVLKQEFKAHPPGDNPHNTAVVG